eukprot:TRINITY_DN102784_c0_g1_i1.p1 TRINITY_DN102784_c0_g1~~TRINITY_DN102784_c0_g1_i1.p1  ORF type:complete len:299 (-),score=77.87 TRINITY_DN102784_c0_g1_i1:147-986(-)
MARLDSISQGETALLRASLQALVQENGSRREELRVRQQREEAAARQQMQEAFQEAGYAAGSSSEPPRIPSAGTVFTADLVLREEDTGFELWLGGLEDALNLRALRDLGISAVLNCALADCEAEIACFRPTRRGGRARSHTRNVSMQEGGSLDHGWMGLHRDQIWSLASFDGDWYSDVLECEVAYEAFLARDEAGYDMRDHCPEISKFLCECRKSGRKVLVHCVMGINRSAFATVAFLAGAMGMSLKAAVALAAEKRGCVLSNDTFVDQLISSFATKEDL